MLPMYMTVSVLEILVGQLSGFLFGAFLLAIWQSWANNHHREEARQHSMPNTIEITAGEQAYPFKLHEARQVRSLCSSNWLDSAKCCCVFHSGGESLVNLVKVVWLLTILD